jgi:hypothetical protein
MTTRSPLLSLLFLETLLDVLLMTSYESACDMKKGSGRTVLTAKVLVEREGEENRC